MTFDPDIHHRRSIRLQDYDYARPGAYFLTTCAQDRECLFGDVRDEEMQLNEFGDIVQVEWTRSASIRQGIESDAFVVMPNHFHGILVIRDDGRGTARRAPTAERYGRPVSGSVPTIVRSFKSAVTKRINVIRKTPGFPVWQRNYFERIIRDEEELSQIREYVTNNPARWAEDEYHPDAPRGPVP